jgi:hypothetical protein
MSAWGKDSKRRDLSMASSFYKLLKNSIGRQIRIQGHGTEMAVGILWHCGDDYLVLKDENGRIMIYPGNSVYIVYTIIGKDGDRDFEGTPAADEKPGIYSFDSETVLDFRECRRFAEVLEDMPKRIVQIGDGPGKLRGIILDVESDYVCVISDLKEITYIPFWAIKHLICNPEKPCQSQKFPCGSLFGRFR